MFWFSFKQIMTLIHLQSAEEIFLLCHLAYYQWKNWIQYILSKQDFSFKYDSSSYIYFTYKCSLLSSGRAESITFTKSNISKLKINFHPPFSVNIKAFCSNLIKVLFPCHPSTSLLFPLKHVQEMLVLHNEWGDRVIMGTTQGGGGHKVEIA